MALFDRQEQPRLEAIGALNYTNPFSPERRELEKTLLGTPLADGAVWHMHSGAASRRDIARIAELAEECALELSRRAAEPERRISADEDRTADRVMIYHLFEKYRRPLTDQLLTEPGEVRFELYREFRSDFARLLERPNRKTPIEFDPARSFAIFHQIHRAFYHIFDFIIGGTLAAGRLRAAIWQSIFSCDIYRYNRVLFDRMNQVTTLIQGESGTGKELVARAIAGSQFIRFDPESRRFQTAYPDCFLPVQLSAMPRPLVESELFGHRKGAYTGALEDRSGYLEACPESGSVFLDEIGEIDPETQVKLLRVLQSRRFQRLGETAEREFRGRIITATNRDLGAECARGAFRTDLYYRLCTDSVATVPLRELTGGNPAELERFVAILAARWIGKEEASGFTPRAVRWIECHLGAAYPWPGNVRELEQCVRSLLIRGSYSPAVSGSGGELDRLLSESGLSADQLLRRYARLLKQRFGSDLAAAKAAGIDRRTLHKYLE